MATSFSRDIRPLFTDKDATCMKPRGILLEDYTYMSSAQGDVDYPDHSHARHVYARLVGTETPRMPRGGPYWSAAEIGLFASWMDSGYLP